MKNVSITCCVLDKLPIFTDPPKSISDNKISYNVVDISINKIKNYVPLHCSKHCAISVLSTAPIYTQTCTEGNTYNRVSTNALRSFCYITELI